MVAARKKARKLVDGKSGLLDGGISLAHGIGPFRAYHDILNKF